MLVYGDRREADKASSAERVVTPLRKVHSAHVLLSTAQSELF